MTQPQTDALVELEALYMSQTWAHDWKHNILPPSAPANKLACDAIRALPTLLAALRRSPEPVPVAGEVSRFINAHVSRGDGRIIGCRSPTLEEWCAFDAALSTSSVQPEREGFVLVPKEPTEAMIEAAKAARFPEDGTPPGIILARCYRAMLAASPVPSGQGEG